MLSKPRGLFLDMDGTLADSVSMLRCVYFRFLEKFGCVGSDTEFDDLNGPKLSEIVGRLQRLYGLPGTKASLLVAYNKLIDEAYREVLPSAGAKELLETAAKRGWILILVTSNSARRATAWLAQVGYSTLLNFLVSGEEVERGKPWPDLYQAALTRSGCPAADSLAVEDSLQGAQAALAAGLPTFVLTPFGGSRTEWPAEVERIHQLKDLLAWL
jgi:HAD superfamily hydrolase (TIGR01509 family)